MQVHVNQLPVKRNYAVLDKKFHEKILERLLIFSENVANASRLTGISKSVLGRYFRNERNRIRIDSLLKIMDILSLTLDEVEKHIIWVGANNSQGIINPKLPFSFNSREAARFLAAICNDGCITIGYENGPRFSYGRLMYNNNEESLRNSVKTDAESVFGKNICKEFHKRNEFYLVFPSVIRDCVEIVTDFKGKKSENNPPVPLHIFENEELMLGWIEQTIADEGHVKFNLCKFRREIIWRRSFAKHLQEYKLNRDEIRMLDLLGIEYDLKNIGTYRTKTGPEKIRLQMRLSKRKNLLKLRRIINIPCERKDKIFTDMLNGYIRWHTRVD